MNENPEGTPNPLNPTPAAAPTPAPAPAPAPTAVPAPEPEQPGSIVEPAKKKNGKKIGIIIGVIAGVLALGGGVAAALMLTVFKPADAVPLAIEKALSGNYKYVALQGNISGTPTADSSFGVSSLNINFDAQVDMVSRSNSLSATIAASAGNEQDVSFNVEEAQVAGGDMFIKLDGLSESLGEYSSLIPGLNVVETIEGDWLRIGKDDFSSSEGMGILDNSSQCIANAMANASSYSNSLAENYKQNQFVTYSTNDIKLAKKNDTIYRLGFDSNKLASFLNSMNNSGLANELIACTGGSATNKDVTAADVEKLLSDFPTVYVEINGNNDITRAYFDASDKGFTADLTISYPSSVNVSEPSSYKDLSDYLSEILNSFYSGSNSFNFDFNEDDYDFDYDFDFDSDDYDFDFDLDFDDLDY